ncbi:MAG TPA: STAS domain-containing protein [Candidatus Krumholzibacteria bacterium]|nr:STAS domain-containing protein [Candidatus Krumholzibacteria bacterium]
MDDLQVDFESLEPRDALILRARGFVDTSTAGLLERALQQAAEGPARFVVIDLVDVDYISSAGWGVMISAVSAQRAAGGDLRLASMRPEVREVFELLEFPSILDAYASVDEALAGDSD